MNILITGSGSGIGYAAALRLAKLNHHIFALIHSEKDFDKFKLIKNITPLLGDITSEEDRNKLDNLEIDVLINSAGIGKSGPVSYVPLKDVKENFEVNVFGTLAMIQLFAPTFIKKNKGRIINISSVAGKIALPYLGVYTATKFALEALSDSLRQELHPYGIFVSIVEPGPIATGFNEKMIESKEYWLLKSAIPNKEVLRMKKYHQSLVQKQYQTDSVVNAIVHAVESKHPKIRYVAPRKYWYLVQLATVLPDKLRDLVLRFT